MTRSLIFAVSASALLAFNAFTAAPAAHPAATIEQADVASGANDGIELDNEACTTEQRWVPGLKAACDAGGKKQARKLMKTFTKALKQKCRAQLGKPKLKLKCSACHQGNPKDGQVESQAAVDAVKNCQL